MRPPARATLPPLCPLARALPPPLAGPIHRDLRHSPSSPYRVRAPHRPDQRTACRRYVWQTSSYIIWPAAAKMLLSRLPIDCPTDCYISKLVLEGKITAVVACPHLAEQRDPYAKGDIKHTNTYKWQVQQ